MNYLAVFVGGGLGSVLRYGLTLLMPRISGTFPWATFWANVSATMLLAVLVVVLGKGKSAPDQMWYVLFGIGLCGGFSTFSTFSFESIDLWRSGHPGLAIFYVLGSLLACLGAVSLLMSLLKTANG